MTPQYPDSFFTAVSPQARLAYADAVLHVAECPIVAFDLKGNVTLVNRNCCDMLGWTDGELLGCNWIDTVVPESQRPLVEAELAQMVDGQVAAAERTTYWVSTKHGGQRLIRWFNTLSKDANGQVTGVLSSGVDITAEHEAQARTAESEALLKQITDHLREVFWLTDVKKTKVFYASPSYEKMWGLPLEQLYREPLSFLMAIHPDDRARVAASLGKQALDEYDETYRLLRPDGTERWIRDRAFPVMDADGKPYRIAGLAEDITEQRSIQESLHQRLLELAHCEQLCTMGEMAHAMAHDVRQPLFAMINYAHVLDRKLSALGSDAESLTPVLAALHQQAERAVDIINGISNVARHSNQQMEPVAMAGLIGNALTLMKIPIERQGVTVQVTLQKPLPRLMIYRLQIDQVLINLIRNGVDAMADTTDRALHIRAWQNGDDEVEITVQDTGIGIDPATGDRVAEPFFTTKTERIGMGLSICQTIIDGHRGRLWHTPNNGPGTTFHITLPMGGDGDEHHG